MPNKDVFGSPLENWSANGIRRIDLEVGVNYDADLAKVKEVSIAAASSVAGRVDDREPEVLFTGFGDSSIDLVVRVWAAFKTNRKWLEVKSELLVALNRAYAEAGIEMPYRTLTVELVKPEPETPSEPG